LRLHEGRELVVEEGEDIEVSDLFELEGTLDVGLEEGVHLTVGVKLLDYLSNEDILNPLLHFLGALLQQEGIGVLLGNRGRLLELLLQRYLY
jgi:hypothetical protein